MADTNPIADVQVKDCRLTVVQLTWQDGTRRTIATSKAADLVSVGIMVKGGASPQEIEAAFPGGSFPNQRDCRRCCGGWSKAPRTDRRRSAADGGEPVTQPQRTPRGAWPVHSVPHEANCAKGRCLARVPGSGAGAVLPRSWGFGCNQSVMTVGYQVSGITSFRPTSF
jgi:hypothetical protein